MSDQDQALKDFINSLFVLLVTYQSNLHPIVFS